MNQLKSLAWLTCLVLLVACNSNEESNVDASTGDATGETALFQVMAIQHPVADFDKWMQGYMAHDSVRQAYGLSHMYVAREVNEPSQVMVVNRMESMEQSKEFSSLPNLEQAMNDAGVIGAPEFHYVNILRSDTANKPGNRVIIRHKVSDWDTWLKAYDGEGKDMRKQHGLEDVGLGRSIEDPDMVYVVFAVNDMDKAKARLESAELKQLMMNAGVEGEPEVTWFNIVD